jgi:uncharacterized protein YoxC
METVMKADIFFFVTTVCVIAVSFFVIIFLIKASRFMQTLRHLAEMLKDKVEDVGEETEELIEKIEESFIFRLLFSGSKRSRRKKR